MTEISEKMSKFLHDDDVNDRAMTIPHLDDFFQNSQPKKSKNWDTLTNYMVSKI